MKVVTLADLEAAVNLNQYTAHKSTGSNTICCKKHQSEMHKKSPLCIQKMLQLLKSIGFNASCVCATLNATPITVEECIPGTFEK